MVIQNSSDLATTEARKDALEITEAGFAAVNTEKVIKKNVRLDGDNLFIKNEKYSFSDIKRIFVVGIGKCSLEAAMTIEDILGDKITDGAVLDLHGGDLKRIKSYIGDHPLPTQRNVDATKNIINLLSGTKEDDLVIFIISGGGSTLLCQSDTMTCQDESEVFKCLTKQGADIKSLNTVRKHLSFARGGFLAKHAYPSYAASLIFSDVLGDDLGYIASGPTVKDNSTIQEAIDILEKFDVENQCGMIKKGLIETPKEDKYFEKVKNLLVVSNKFALDAMKEAAEKLGYQASVCDLCLAGEATTTGTNLADEINKAKSGSVRLYGGETTVTIKGNGRGGRNMELALSALKSINDDCLVLPVASDGRDNSDFAGAIADKTTKDKSEKLNLNPDDFLKNNNSFEFFNKTKDALITGYTGSNVADLTIVIKNK